MSIIIRSHVLLKLNTTVKLTKTDEKTIRTILASCMFSPRYEIGLLLITARQATQL